MPEKLNDHELEGRLIYSLIVAGKTADHADRTTRSFLSAALGLLKLDAGPTPLTLVRMLIHKGLLGKALRQSKCGNYNKMETALKQIVQGRHLNLRTCTPQQLERIDGIGPKTSRFFITWTRSEARHAVLDTHILRWLRENGYPDAPRATPTSPRYAYWEDIFIAEADKRKKTPRQLDIEIWSASTRSRL